MSFEELIALTFSQNISLSQLFRTVSTASGGVRGLEIFTAGDSRARYRCQDIPHSDPGLLSGRSSGRWVIVVVSRNRPHPFHCRLFFSGIPLLPTSSCGSVIVAPFQKELFQ